MKNFSKYITQGMGLAIGIVIVGLAISGILYIKSGFDVAKVEKDQQRQDMIDFERIQLEKIGLNITEINAAMDNGVNIEKDGVYEVKVVSGVGDVTIYDIDTATKIKTMLSVNKDKDVEFEGKPGYKVVPAEGLKIKCIKK